LHNQQKELKKSPIAKRLMILRELHSTLNVINPIERWCRLLAVRAENLNPDVLVMQPANKGVRHDASDLLNRARDRRINLTVEWLARQITEAFPWDCVCRKPRPFDLVKESRNVGHDGRAALLPFETHGLRFASLRAARDTSRENRVQARSSRSSLTVVND